MKLLKFLLALSILFTLFGCQKETPETPDEPKEEQKEEQKEEISIIESLKNILDNADSVTTDQVNEFLTINLKLSELSEYVTTAIDCLNKYDDVNDAIVNVFASTVVKGNLLTNKPYNFNNFIDLLLYKTELSRAKGLVNNDYAFEKYSFSDEKYVNQLLEELEKLDLDVTTLEKIVKTIDVYKCSEEIIEKLLSFINKDKYQRISNNIISNFITKYFDGEIDISLLKVCMVNNQYGPSIYTAMLDEFLDNPTKETFEKYINLVTDEEGNIPTDLFTYTVKKQLDDNFVINFTESWKNRKYTDWTVKKVEERDADGSGYGIEIGIYGNYVISLMYDIDLGYIVYDGNNLKNIVAYENDKYYFIANDTVYSITREKYEVSEVFTQANITMFEVVNDNIVCLLEDNSVVKYNPNDASIVTTTFTDWATVTSWALGD